MTHERRYGDDEIRRILDLAMGEGEPAGAPPPSATEGLTLAQLQDVGRQVGVEPERVARAAMLLDSDEGVLPRGRTLGLPTSVGRVVELPRAMTDREWELLVSDLRMTFNAKGRVTSHGNLREWSNGNLHAFIEPTETGHRLRLTTFKGDAMGINAIGGVFLLFALMIFVVLLGKEDPGGRFIIPILFALVGGGALATNVLGLPRWANGREEQMEYIANRAKALLAAPALEDHEP